MCLYVQVIVTLIQSTLEGEKKKTAFTRLTETAL